MLSNNNAAKNSIVKLPCPNCGSQLSYSVEKKLIACGHCGFSRDFDKSNDLVVEQSLAQAANQTTKYNPRDNGKKVIDCSGCGAQLMIDEAEVSVRCNFCGSAKVNEKAFNQNLIQPQGVLPFKISKRVATEAFRNWIKKGWFHPNKLKKLAALGDVHGIYVPFWTYDAQSYAEWSGEAGHHYYVTEQVYENGEWKNKQVKKTRWEWRSGSFNRDFDDVLILASKGLPEKIIDKITPYNLNEVVNHNSELIVGWESEIYSVDLKDGYNKAEQRMMDAVREQASSDLRRGADTSRGLSVDADFYNQTFKHIILPVWLCTYQYNEKAYQFAVNGQTGKINGQKPLSTIKIVLFVLFILTIIGTIIFLVMTAQNN